MIHSTDVGGFPIRVEVTPDGKRALVSQARARAVIEIELDGWKVARTLEIGAFPVGIEIRPDGKVAYVANTEEPDGMAWTSS